MSSLYINKLTIHQRGGSIDFDNSTNKEQLHISHRSGSNVNYTNVVTSELTFNNKQSNITNDSFITVGGDSSSYVGGDAIVRTAGTSYALKGFATEEELNAYAEWRDTYRPIANTNSKFKIKRGGVGYPNGAGTLGALVGDRASNPTLNLKVTTVENTFNGYNGIPSRTAKVDQVATYVTVIDRGTTKPAKEQDITSAMVEKAAGKSGSFADGVVNYGATKSAATEQGTWENNKDTSAEGLAQAIENLQPTLTEIEQKMGVGGDDINQIKRDKTLIVGAAFNDFPSIRIDTEGRSHPHEILVGVRGAFKNYDYAAVIEDVDNSSVFPGGVYNKIIGNQYNITIGSGGYTLKTTGNVEFGGATLKSGFKKVVIASTYGTHLISDTIVDITALKSITLRTNRQVMVESAMGVKNNLIVGGGAYIEGETYLNHITAPLEVQQTQDTIVYGQFNTSANRVLPIGEAFVFGSWHPVYALAAPDIIITPPHSHHFNNLPLRLTSSNSDMREIAQAEDINSHGTIAVAKEQIHERKLAITVTES